MTFESGLFDGKTVVVVGGTSGIGAATARAFAEAGAKVDALGLNAGGKEAVHASGIANHELDVRETDKLTAFFDHLGELDVLVNCAGTSHHREEWQADKFADIMDINFNSVFHACRSAQPHMPAGSAIVNIASMYSTFGSLDRPAYASSKGAVVQLTKSMAQEYAPAIRVNAVAPGWIDTPLSTGLFSDPVASTTIMSRIPAQRWGKPEEIAETIMFLASPAASYITGTVIAVDGGYLTV